MDRSQHNADYIWTLELPDQGEFMVNPSGTGGPYDLRPDGTHWRGIVVHHVDCHLCAPDHADWGRMDRQAALNLAALEGSETFTFCRNCCQRWVPRVAQR